MYMEKHSRLLSGLRFCSLVSPLYDDGINSSYSLLTLPGSAMSEKVMNENRFHKIVTNGVNGRFFICLFSFAAFNGTVSNWVLAKAICAKRFRCCCLVFSGKIRPHVSVDIVICVTSEIYTPFIFVWKGTPF